MAEKKRKVNETIKNSYLMIDSEKSTGVVERLYKFIDYNELTKPTEDTDIATGGVTASPSSIPNPLSGITIQLPAGSLTTTALGWAATGEADSGRYRIGSLNYGEAVNGALKFDWDADRMLFATGFQLRLNDLTAGSVLFAGSSKQITQDNANLFWDDTANRLGIGTTGPDATLDILNASATQLRLTKTDGSDYADFRANAGLTIGVNGTTFITLATDGDLTGSASNAGVHRLSWTNTNNGGVGQDSRIRIGANSSSRAAIEFYDNQSGTLIWSLGNNAGASPDKFFISQGTDPDANHWYSVTTYGENLINSTSGSGRTGETLEINCGGVPEAAPVSDEFVEFKLWSQGSVAFADSITVTNQRFYKIHAPSVFGATGGGSTTVTNCSTLWIENAPSAVNDITITNAYALWVDDGLCRFDGKTFHAGEVEIDGALNHDGTTFGIYSTTPAGQDTGGQDVTNNVTDSGSTAGVIPDITDGTTYANDYTNLRRALYQLARMLKQDHDWIRSIGGLT